MQAMGGLETGEMRPLRLIPSSVRIFELAGMLSIQNLHGRGYARQSGRLAEILVEGLAMKRTSRLVSNAITAALDYASVYSTGACRASSETRGSA